MMGYDIQTTDGSIGHLSDLRVDDGRWTIHELVVETGHWYSGKKILIAPDKVKHVSYEEAKVFVTLTKEDIQRAPEGGMARAAAGTR